MVILNRLSLSFGTRSLFEDLSLNIMPEQRIGLAGRNGSGKSTLLKIIAEQAGMDRGTVTVQKNVKIAYLPQEVTLRSQKTILDEALSAHEELYALMDQARLIEQTLNAQTGQEQDPKLVETYAQLQLEISAYDADNCIAETKKTLSGLGFTDEMYQKSVETLSVGWKMKLVLAKLLLQKADLYLFDEPTNHLDLYAQDWFFDFLKKSSFAFLLVCHERYFLDHLCTHILALDHGKGTLYTGNYAHYEAQKEARDAATKVAYEHQQKEISRKMETIERFRAKASKASIAQSMLKAIDRMDKITIEREQKSIAIPLNPVTRSGAIVLSVTDIAQQYGDKKIFEHVTFEINRGEKVALVGPNGQGKTTLFNTVIGKTPKKAGSIDFGHKVDAALFEQDQNKALPQDSSILEALEESCPRATQARIRSMLGAFLFSGDAVHKKIRVLSGGEKNRVAMVKVLLQDANFILLDEPTNHLDIQSKDILAKTLLAYDGTIFFVSHDRDFLNKVATRVIVLNAGGVHSYAGNWDDYLYQEAMLEKEKLKAQVAQLDKKSPESKKQSTESSEAKKDHGLNPRELFELRKKGKRLEAQIAKFEREIETLQASLATLAATSSEFAAMAEKLRAQELAHQEAYAAWEKILEIVD